MYDAQKYFDQLMNGEIQNSRLAGANILVIDKDKEIFFQSYGYADKERNIPMKRDTMFRIFSMTKPITAAAVMILFERGMLDLFDPVSKYLPGFKNQKVLEHGSSVPVKREVEIRDLLNMTSGIPYPDKNQESQSKMSEIFENTLCKIKEGGRTNTIEFCNSLGACPLEFQPGEKWLYGFSADILGGIVETISKETLGEFFKNEIFNPLGMNDTGFYLNEKQRSRLAQAYQEVSGGHLQPYTDIRYGIDPDANVLAYESGGAGLYSTIDDYKKFAMMLCHGGTYEGRRVLSKKTVDFMRTNQLTEQQQSTVTWEFFQGVGYGNLMRVLLNKAGNETNGTNGEFGWDGWMGTYFTIDPVNESVILYFIQRVNTGTNEITRKVRAIAYAMLSKNV